MTPTKISAYRLTELHDDMEEVLLDIVDPSSDDAKKLRSEIEQLKHVPDIGSTLEQREIYAMRARQYIEEPKQVIILNLSEANHRRARLLVALQNCPIGTEREQELRAMIRALDKEIAEINARSAIEAAQRIHSGG